MKPQPRVGCHGVLLGFALLAAACGGDGGSGSGTATDVRTVKSGTLTVCSDIPYAPFEFEEGGRQVGIDIELVQAIAGELRLQPVIKDTDFDGIFAALAAGQCDMIASSVSITEERRQNNDFTQGYYEIRQSLLVRKADADRYRTLEDLRGRTIGVQSGTTGETYAQDKAGGAGFSIRSFTGVDEMFTALQASQIDGIVQDLPINAYNAQKTGQTAVTRLDSPPEQYGFVIRKGNTALRDAADGALAKVRSDGRYQEILKRYLGEAGA